jgi:hypothetical protein
VEALPSCHHGFGFGFGPVVGRLADLADCFGFGMTDQKSVGFPD